MIDGALRATHDLGANSTLVLVGVDRDRPVFLRRRLRGQRRLDTFRDLQRSTAGFRKDGAKFELKHAIQSETFYAGCELELVTSRALAQ